MTATVTAIGDVCRAVAYTTSTPDQLAELEVAAALATVTQIRPFFDDRPAPRHCECDHDVHRPIKMFGPTSRYRVASSGPAHARSARLRDADPWFHATEAGGPRVCEDCHYQGHNS